MGGEGLGWPRPGVARIRPKAPLLRYVPGTMQFIWLLPNHPRMMTALFTLEGMAEFGQPVLASLNHRGIELVVLRANWNAGHYYHWSAHAIWGRIRERKGFLEAVKEGPGASRWNTRQSTLLRAVDELHDDLAIHPETVRRLREVGYGDRHLIETCFITAHYELLGMLLESAGVPHEVIFPGPDPDERPVPRRRRSPTRIHDPGLDPHSPWLPGSDDVLSRHRFLHLGLRRFGQAMTRISTLDYGELAAALARTDQPAGSPREAAIRAAVEELDREYFISDQTWQSLAAHLTPKQVMELCVLVGHYRTHEMVANSLRPRLSVPV